MFYYYSYHVFTSALNWRLALRYYLWVMRHGEWLFLDEWSQVWQYTGTDRRLSRGIATAQLLVCAYDAPPRIHVDGARFTFARSRVVDLISY